MQLKEYYMILKLRHQYFKPDKPILTSEKFIMKLFLIDSHVFV